MAALLLVSDVVGHGDTLSLGLQHLRGLSLSPGGVGCDGEGTEEADGGLCTSEVQEACSSDPQIDRAVTDVSSLAVMTPQVLLVLQKKHK